MNTNIYFSSYIKRIQKILNRMSKEKYFHIFHGISPETTLQPHMVKKYTKHGKAFSFFGHGYGSETWTSIVSLNPPMGLQENE